MRRVVTLSILTLSAGLVAGCDLKEVYPTNIAPMAGVRFINAVPDTAGAYGMDLRFVDYLESNAHFRQHFRNLPVTSGGVTGATGVQYKHARAGQRHFRIFLDDTLQSLATVVLKDTTVTLNAGSNYTAILWGYANPTGPSRPAGAPAMRLDFIEETVADPGAGSTALRFINATGYPVNGEQFVAAGAPTGTATWASVPALSVTTHVVAAVGQKRFAVTPTPANAGATPFYAVAQPLALIGVPDSSTAGPAGVHDIEALPGTTVAGSAITMILFPQSIRGLPRVAQHTTAIVTGRRAGSITAVAGGYRITDCFVSADCLAPDNTNTPADADALPDIVLGTNPAMVVNGCAPDVFGDCTILVTPPAGSLLPAITVVASANASGTIDTAADLSAYVAAYNALGVSLTYTVVGYHAAGVSIWDRRPAYLP